MLVDFVKEHREEVLSECARRLSNGPSQELSRQLIGELPLFVDEVVASLESNQLPMRASGAGKSKMAGPYGKARQLNGLSVEHAAEGFGVVCDSITSLAARNGLSFGAREFQILNQSVDEAVSASLTEYWRSAQAQENSLRSEKLGFLAHELRNSLTNIRTAFSLIKLGRVGANSRTGDLLEHGMARMKALIDQMLASAQLGAGARVERETVDVAALLEELDHGAFPDRGVRIAREVRGELTLRADPKLLTSIVGNLLQNALKFTDPNSTVRLRARGTEAEVIIEVEDECGGLSRAPEELMASFAQGQPDRRGYGLGLAIVRDAVTAHQGQLEVENRRGRGCVFRVSLPRHPPSSEQEISPSP